MNPLKIELIIQYVEEHIGEFHKKRINALNNLALTKVLRKKNPYLFKAKNILTVPEIVKSITDAYISSQEETLFGNWLEGLAIFINKEVYNGWKSGITGIDLEFNLDNTRFIVAIKSGPNWGNSSQINKMKLDFLSAKRALKTSNSNLIVEAVNGCCYGKEKHWDKGEYQKLCGQKFWEFISGDDELYLKIIEPLGHKAFERNAEIVEAYSNIINTFNSTFISTFCQVDGSINWEFLVKYNSAIKII